MDAYDVFVMRFESNVNRRYLPIPGLQRVFGIDRKAAEQIARNLPRAVKRRVTLEVAAKYAEALREIGAEVQLRPCQDDRNQSQSTPPAAQVQVSEASSSPDGSDGQVSSQTSHSIDSDTAGSQPAQSTRQSVDDFSNGGIAAKDDDRRSLTSTRPSTAVDLSPGSLPQAREVQNATRTRDLASRPDVTTNAANRSQGAGSVWPHTTNVALRSSSSTRSSTRAVDHATSPLGHGPSSSPPRAAGTNDSIPEEALKKSLWAPGTGYVLAGSVLILIGLSFDESMFTGNASITDYLFDILGLCWIVWGLFKLVKKGSGLQLG